MWGGSRIIGPTLTAQECCREQLRFQRKQNLGIQHEPSDAALLQEIALLCFRWWLMPCLQDIPRSMKLREHIRDSYEQVQKEVEMPKIKELDLDQSMDEISSKVQQWVPGNFKRIKALQDAPRCHGEVDMMQELIGAGRFVAVKKMPTSWLKTGPAEFKESHPRETENPWRDMGILMTLNAMNMPFACDLLGIYRDAETTYIVSSLATKGDLFSWSSQLPKPGKAREAMIKPVMIQIWVAVKFLHEIGISHRDLSLENILLTESSSGEMVVKIIDFGMSIASQRGCGSRFGKPPYKAPEMHLKTEYDFFLSDAFATGVVLYAMAWQRYPWKSTELGKDKAFMHARKHGIMSLDWQRNKENQNMSGVSYPFEFYQLLEGLLTMEPCARLNFGESCFAERRGISVWNIQWW